MSVVRAHIAWRPALAASRSLFAACPLVLTGVFSACKPTTEEAHTLAAPSGTALLEAADESAPLASAVHKTGVAQSAGERVAIPTGKLVCGSTPGDLGRDPMLEPALAEFELAAFEIDKLPYPNDPKKPPLTGSTRAKAAELCAEASARLCSELEWERACKGLAGQAFAGADAWAPSCAENPASCASGFGVLALGAGMREWTASDVAPIKGFRTHAAAAVRGARADAAAVDHRCAHRSAVDADTSSSDLGFRCCSGAPNAPVIASPETLPPIEEIEFAPERLAALFASTPKLEAFASELKYFRKEAAIATVKKRGAERAAADAASPPPGEVLTTSPLLWRPVPGEEVLVVAGQAAKDRSFVVAFHRLPGDRYRVASAFLMDDEPGPVVLTYSPHVRKKLGWAICLECSGEAGNISYRDENRVTITQK
ncbi:MAG: hypothetical protein EXR75_03020 [Myxococcales bacterium]|nr:hypothetical protein [Myxococcales bacterium]